MGLKSGSRDAGLDDEEPDDTTEGQSAGDASEGQSADDSTGSGGGEPEAGPASEPEAGPASETGAAADTGADSGRPSMDSIPYKLRRDKVNEGRQQVPYFLRDAVIEGEADLQDAVEAMLDEDVYKSDYREAAMVVAQRNPELVAAVLREWGYDLD